MAQPVLENMANGELQKNMKTEFSPSFDNRDRSVVYMETFGRLMAGIAPWLTLPDDATAEGQQRKQLREWALQSYKNAVDPESPDYLCWGKAESDFRTKPMTPLRGLCRARDSWTSAVV